MGSTVGLGSTVRCDVVVVGGGIIGLASAWRLAQRGLGVTIVDPAPASAATRAAAGMLAPISEASYGETTHLQLALESLRRYGQFVAELESATSQAVGLRREGTIIAATDSGDYELLRELHDFQTSLGLSAQLLTSRESRQIEPALGPDVRAALQVHSDHSVDNRLLAAALLTAVESRGVRLVKAGVTSVEVVDGSAIGVALDNGDRVEATTTVVAAGAWSAALPGIPVDATPQVRPVKGQILRLRATAYAQLPTYTLRGLVNGHDIYLVPRAAGELVVGATVEEMGFDTSIRAGAIRELLRDARTIMPSVDELELVETTAALRPGSPDNLPMIGATNVAHLVVATGHHRNGILLAPITADLVAATILGTSDTLEQQLLEATAPQRHRHAAARI